MNEKLPSPPPAKRPKYVYKGPDATPEERLKEIKRQLHEIEDFKNYDDKLNGEVNKKKIAKKKNYNCI